MKYVRIGSVCVHFIMKSLSFLLYFSSEYKYMQTFNQTFLMFNMNNGHSTIGLKYTNSISQLKSCLNVTLHCRNMCLSTSQTMHIH